MIQQKLTPIHLFISEDENGPFIIYNGIIMRFLSFSENEFQYCLFNLSNLVITIPKYNYIIDNIEQFFLFENADTDLCNLEKITELN